MIQISSDFLLMHLELSLSFLLLQSFTDFIEKVSQILSCKLKAISLLQQEIQIHGASISAAGGQMEEAVFCGGSRDPSK